MIDELFPAAHWAWWGLGTLLVVFEVVVAGTFLLWMGVSAGVLGVIVYFAQDLPWEIQFVLFAVFSLASIFLSRKYLQRSKDDESSLSARGKCYLGTVATVEESIVNGIGKVRVADTVWRAQGPNVAAGGRVKITGITGVTFEVVEVP